MHFLNKFLVRPDPPVLSKGRARAGNTAAIVLVHGWTGRVISSFGDLVTVLSKDHRFDGYDILRLQYTSSLRLDLQAGMRQPELAVLGEQLATTLEHQLRNYRSVCLIGHSMGGLVMQEALLDPKARRDVTHVMLLGTPSVGVRIPRLIGRLMRQVRDLAFNSPFITQLRSRWDAAFAGGMPFGFVAVAGSSDELVRDDSSIEPFPEQFRERIAGNHGQIAAVDSADHPMISLLASLLAGHAMLHDNADLARLALEQRDYHQVIERLGLAPHELDPDAVVTLALAYDAVGRRNDAIQLLETAGKHHTDALGVLAGRYKRNWIVDRREQDLAKSRELYSRALQESRAASDSPQIFYHAINLAFLDVVSTPESTAEPKSVAELAVETIQAARRVKEADYWSEVSVAEANVVLRRYDDALAHYRAGAAHEARIRQRESTYQNARYLLEKRNHSRLSPSVFDILMV